MEKSRVLVPVPTGTGNKCLHLSVSYQLIIYDTGTGNKAKKYTGTGIL
jgi:hypothetical protein